MRAAIPLKRTTVDLVRVHPSPLDRRAGRLVAGPFSIPCRLGRGGATRAKREGDGASPIGRFALIQVLYRPDRGPRPATRLPVFALRPADGWCDAPGDRRYNRPVRLPCAASHEAMWRDDHLYDLVVDIAFNRGPIRPGRGSAIFLHLQAKDGTPTAGCVAVPRRHARALLARLGPKTRIAIG